MAQNTQEGNDRSNLQRCAAALQAAKALTITLETLAANAYNNNQQILGVRISSSAENARALTDELITLLDRLAQMDLFPQ